MCDWCHESVVLYIVDARFFCVGAKFGDAGMTPFWCFIAVKMGDIVSVPKNLLGDDKSHKN